MSRTSRKHTILTYTVLKQTTAATNTRCYASGDNEGGEGCRAQQFSVWTGMKKQKPWTV